MVLTGKTRPGVVTPFAIALLARVVRPITRVLHRATLDGEEHLPAEPYVLVGYAPPEAPRLPPLREARDALLLVGCLTLTLLPAKLNAPALGSRAR